jgi:hypothetical protein
MVSPEDQDLDQLSCTPVMNSVFLFHFTPKEKGDDMDPWSHFRGTDWQRKLFNLNGGTVVWPTEKPRKMEKW